MKLSPVQVLSFCGASLLIAATFVLSSAPTPRAGQGRHMVRMPVDTRIIDLETLNAPNPQDNATISGAQPSVSATPKAGVSKPAPAAGSEKSAPKAVSDKPSTSSPSAAAKKDAAQSKTVTGSITGLKVEQAEDGSLIVRLRADRDMGRVTYLRLGSPSRLVIDVRGRWTLRAGNVVRMQAGPYAHLVAGEHKDRLRLVLHSRDAGATVPVPGISVQGRDLAVTVPASAKP